MLIEKTKYYGNKQTFCAKVNGLKGNSLKNFFKIIITKKLNFNLLKYSLRIGHFFKKA